MSASNLPRRTFVGASLTTATGAGLAMSGVGRAAAGLIPSTGRRVAVIGAGPGGLTAAHELAERGFSVTVYERKALGGKARSIPVSGTAAGGRADLPGEHGFRFFPGFYQNVTETMSRIPFGDQPNGVRDNLVAAEVTSMAWKGREFSIPVGPSGVTEMTPEAFGRFFTAAVGTSVEVPPQDLALFTSKAATFFASGPKRRMQQWENTSWSDFMRMDTLSPAGRALLVDFPTSALVAAKADVANTRTIGLMMEALFLSAARQGGYTDPDQLLNAPTNESWIDPWVLHLRGLGVQFNVGWTVTGLSCPQGRIKAASALDPTGAPRTIEADWFVLAVPVERAIPLLNAKILAIDPRLQRLRNLTTDWMNGVMIYTKEATPIVKGHVAYIGEPWALTSINQASFWGRDFASTYGDGSVRDCLSVDVSNWDAPGILYGKPAKECTRQEIVDEVIAQIRHALPDGDARLPDSNIHSWFVDPAITGEGTPSVANDEPLLVNTVSSWWDRPAATTKVPNLFLAADYVRSSVNLATMEGANEAGKAAANGVLDASGSLASRAVIRKLHEPLPSKVLWAEDDLAFDLGLPNAFDVVAPDRPAGTGLLPL
ncbi:MAG TPA: FAD-dependent oxidoreductase [Nocardioidaceae bacterium]|nr:FAD-dependent oxidoreductase [Nocardioidaceae bacterium]